MKLKELRLQINKTQAQVARDLNISRQSYSFYESNQRDPDTETVILLAKYFGVTTDVILGVEDIQEFPFTPQDKELIACFHTLTDENKYKVLGMIRLLQYEQSTQQDEAPSKVG